jgi:hypothetical protein
MTRPQMISINEVESEKVKFQRSAGPLDVALNHRSEPKPGNYRASLLGIILRGNRGGLLIADNPPHF